MIGGSAYEQILKAKSGFMNAEGGLKEIFRLKGHEKSLDKTGDKSDRKKRRNMIRGFNSRDNSGKKQKSIEEIV